MSLNSKDFWKGFFKGDHSIMGLEPFQTKLTEKEILDFRKKLEWKGVGTEIDPIIIPSEEGLPQLFSILGSKLYLKIIDCRFDHIILYNCQNVSIDNNSFKILGIFKSSGIDIEYCDISNLNLDHCSNCLFKNCSIEDVGNLRSHGNVFEHCQITTKAQKKLLQGLLELPNLKYWPIVVIAAGFGITAFTLIHILNSVPFSIYWYLSVISFPILIIILIYLSKIKKRNIPNKIIPNQNLTDKLKGIF
ncbi:MAG: hypothetical protein ACFFDF_05270 [Candidatus Odinarchaeota archaeon]